MGKCKRATLTKIDPALLKPRVAPAVSQHKSSGGERVTTTVNPVQPRTTPVPLQEPALFCADPPNFTKDCLGGEGISESYFSTKASSSHILSNDSGSFSRQDNPLLSWATERDTFLDELIRLEGWGMFTDGKCELCSKAGEYRCVDCLGVQILCKHCITGVHAFNPLHVIEVSWSVFHG